MSRGVRREGLSRRHRFRGRDSFRPLLRSPRKFSGTYSVLHLVPATTPAARFGVSIGKRAARGAVERNRIKRRVRDVFRRHAIKHSSFDLVLTLTSKFNVEHVDSLVGELRELMDRAHARMAA